MPFTGPGYYTINSVAYKDPLTFSPETRVLVVGGIPGVVFNILKVGDAYTIESDYFAHKSYYAHVEPTPGRAYPLVVVNNKEPFLWKIAKSTGNDNEEYTVITAEGPYEHRVWTTDALDQPPLVLVDRDVGAPQQRFTFTKVG